MSPEPRAYILDSGAVLAYLEDEEGGGAVEQICRENPGRVFMHAINAGEVFYFTRRAYDATVADAVLERVKRIGVAIRDDMDTAFWKDAMCLKADLARISVADCFFLAMTRRLNGIGVTTDHHEMDPLVPLNLCTLHFIR